MQNASTEGSFLVKKDAITYRLLGATGPVASTPRTRSRAAESIAAAEAITLAPTAAVMVEAGVVPFNPLFGPTELFAGILISNAAEVQQNLLKKALQSKTLSPGASARGFLYVQVPKGVARQTIHLRIPVTRVGDVDPIGFDLVF
jgi:hypothetical protein